MGSTIKKLSKAKTQVNNLSTYMKNYSSKIDTVVDELNKMMKGGANGAYWQGQNAYDWYANAIRRINSMIDNYAHSYNEFEDFAAMYDKAYAKSKTKNLSKGLLARFDGTSFTNGVLKNKDNKRISGVPGTVDTDSANDDQTRESYSAYNTMKTAFKNLSSYCDKMSKVWTNVANNTTGTMNSDAKKRSKALETRKKTIDDCLNSLETEYIGDLLFSR